MTQGSWCSDELASISLGDARLNNRFLKVADNLFNKPSSPIIEASNTWKEAKAAYRLFDNEKFSDSHIRQLHQDKTLTRLAQSKEDVFFAIQDTTTLNYTHHPEKTGMGKINKSKEHNKPVTGCFLHNTLLLTKTGLPLGLLDQKIYKHEFEKIKNNKTRPITEKESYRWLEALEKTKYLCSDANVITICDRESDIYEFFMLANKIDAKILVRASHDRIVFGSKNTEHENLWSFMEEQKVVSTITIEVPAQRNRAKRKAELAVKFSEIIFNPPQRLPSAQIDKLTKIKLNAIWLYEDTNDADRLEWMLLTNIHINNADEAVIIGQYYKIRWQVECYHRVLKSGCQVENCRLETYERLSRYLCLKSIIAYRLFYLTIVNRVSPEAPCDVILAKHEWQALYCHINKTPKAPTKPPTTYEAIRLIAKLGGFLGRNSDGEPGMTTIWRGWNQLSIISELWLVMANPTCG